MRILIGYSRCKLTQAAFEAHGHDAWTCVLLPAAGKHLQMDVWDAIAQGWDFAVLHPMCTYLTISAAWAYADPDFQKYPGVGYHQRVKPGTLVGHDRRIARAYELANFGKLLGLPFPYVLENPGTSFVNKALRPPDQVIHPYQFGDDASKGTGLWRRADVPALRATQYVQPRWVCCGLPLDMELVGNRGCANCNGDNRPLPRWANQTDSGQNRLSPSDNRWLERSSTYPGIAAALGDQYGRWLNQQEGIELRSAA